MHENCDCRKLNLQRRIVITGGPGAGKTAILDLVRQALRRHVTVLPDAASIVFGGGFPRNATRSVQRSAQRAIFSVQHELEAAADSGQLGAILCDRATLDCYAYWPGPDDFWNGVGASRQELFARYDAVIHLRVPEKGHGHGNPFRRETTAEARVIDDRIIEVWRGHPRRHVIEPTERFRTKASRALEIIRQELPACCQTEDVMLPEHAFSTAFGYGLAVPGVS